MNSTSIRRSFATIGLLLLSVNLSAEPREIASFRKLFPHPGELLNESASDNIRACAPHVRHAVRSAREKWGRFHYTCTHGVVRNIFLSAEDSRINKQPAVFIMENLGLFDLQGAPVTVRFDGDAGTQIYKGNPVPTARIFRVKRKGKIPGIQHVQPITSGDIKYAAGLAIEFYVAFELGVVDPEDESVNPHRVKPVK